MNIFDITLDSYKIKGLALNKVIEDKIETKNITKAKSERLVKSLEKTYKLELQYLSAAEAEHIELKLDELYKAATPYIELDITNYSIPGTGVKKFQFNYSTFKAKQRGYFHEISLNLNITI